MMRLFLAAALVFVMLPAQAGTSPNLKEARDVRTVHDVRDEVEDLMTSGERQEALKVIANRLRDEKHENIRLELRKLQDEISELFLTEKALQAFELGRSMVLSDIGGALSRFHEASQLEPFNLTVQAAIARAKLQSGDCGQAVEDTKKSLMTNENYKPILFIHVQALICQQSLKAARTVLEQHSNELNVFSPQMALITRGQIAYFEQNYVAAAEAFEKAKGLDAKFPETYYWMGQAAEQLKKDSVAAYRRYLELCQEPNRDRRHQYEYEPRTCLEAKVVERIVEGRAPKPKG